MTIGLTSTLIPFSPSLPLFFALCAINGFAMDSLQAGGNVLCLDIWQGLDDSAPYMHSIHFSYGLGAFVAPLVAESFLKLKSSNETNEQGTRNNQTTQTTFTNETTFVQSGMGIDVLYPIIGTFAIIVSLGYLVLAIKDDKTSCKSNPYKKLTNDGKSNSNNYAIITLVLAFLFIYVGMEKMYGMYLSTFAVESKLHLTRQLGARITAIFWGAFASMRFLVIFLAVKLSPLGTLMFSFFMSIVGSILLAIYGEASLEALSVFTAFMGIGMAPICASCLLWMDQFMTVTNKIGGIMIVAGGIGFDAFPVFLGQFIADFPMLLMYTQVVLIYLCVLLFALASWIGKRK